MLQIKQNKYIPFKTMNKVIIFLLFALFAKTGFCQHHTEYYDDGAKLSKVKYVDGKFHGEVKFWYRNGNLQSKGDYNHGVPIGKHTEWYENTYVKSVTYYDNKGKALSFTLWNEDQQKIVEGKYSDGREDGVWKHYDERGKLVKEDTYKDGQLLSTKDF
jgi:antitoxin component YwqK of YwqJK toxin-antitoxin module